MEISVEGKATLFYTPDMVIMNFNFITKGNSYEEVLNIGVKNVESFINELLKKHGFTNEDLKTNNFIIKEETKYNEDTHKYEFDGYYYNQNAVLKFEYDKEKMAEMMEDISKLSNPPFYQINFGLKDEEKVRKNILTLAYNDALKKAEIISNASGYKLIRCLKTDFRPFTSEYLSQTSINPKMLSMDSVSQNIMNIFTPMEIEITEVLYCLWITE